MSWAVGAVGDSSQLTGVLSSEKGPEDGFTLTQPLGLREREPLCASVFLSANWSHLYLSHHLLAAGAWLSKVRYVGPCCCWDHLILTSLQPHNFSFF